MNCSYCGVQLVENARFCSACGKPIEKKTFCTACGAELNAEQVFCHVCGTKRYENGEIVRKSEQNNAGPVVRIRTANTDNGSIAVPVPHCTGALLKKVSMVTKHNGEPTVTLNHATGTLSVYDNRLEFSNSVGMGLLHTAAVRSRGADVIAYQDVARVRVGSYMGMYATLVVDLRNGQTFSFMAAVPGSSEMKTIVNLISPYIA